MAESSAKPSAPAPESETFEEKFLRTNIEISEWFNGVAEGLDVFLVGRKVTNRRNETSVRLENSTTVKEGEDVVNAPGIAVNLRLPNLEEYWQLKFTSYDESRERREVQREYQGRAPRERNYGASLGFFRKLGNIRTAFEPRVELQDPLRVSHTLTFESVADMQTYEFNPKLQFFANPVQGVGVFGGLNFHFDLSNYYSFTWINQGEYEEKTHLLRVTHGFSIGEPLTDRTSLSYNFFTSTLNQPNYHLASYTISVGWNHMIYKKILDYQITPFLDFQKTNNFTGVPGISLTVRLNF